MHIEISYLVLSAKKMSSSFILKLQQNKLRNAIFYIGQLEPITNCSILEIPDLFLVQYRKNQICLVYLPGHLYGTPN